MEKFKILSNNEENELNYMEKKKYYEELRNYLKNRKLTNTTKGATTIAPKLKGVTNEICKMTTKALSCKNVDIECEGLERIPDGNVIFAQSHQGILDNFIWIPQVDKHSLILHHRDVNKLLLLCQLNTGLVLISKNDKNDGFNAKLDIMSLLSRGFSITWFPEGTYCLSPNKLHLPMKYGFIDVAKKTGVPIIPVVHEYEYVNDKEKYYIKKIYSSYGNPIYVNENDSLKDKLEEYEESISTLKYEIMEKKGIYNRSTISNKDYIDYLKEIYKNIEISGVDKDYEREHIYTAADDFYKFHHINDIPFDEKNNLLDTPENQKLEAIELREKAKKLLKKIN